MRLLNVHRYLFRKGGAEAVFLDHQELFVARGWDCAEFVMSHPDNPPSLWDRFFPGNFDPASSEAPAWKRSARFVYSGEAKSKMAAMLDAFRPDIVHIHGMYQQLTPSILDPIAAKKIPIVYTAHDFKLLCPAYFLFTEKLGVCERCAGGNTIHCAINRCLHNSLAASTVYAADAAFHNLRGSYRKFISAYVMPSRFILQKHAQYGFPAEKLHYIPNFFETTIDTGVPMEDVEALRRRHGDYVLYFGRLSGEKGVAELIAACSLERLPLLIAGAGPQEAELRELAAKSAAPVTFLGFRSGQELWAVVEGALCVVLPSRWYENAPKSVLEAQARGKVVIVSDMGGLPEMVEDRVTGFLFRSGDVSELSGILSHVTRLSADARREIGARARSFALSAFTRERYYNSMSALYEALS